MSTKTESGDCHRRSGRQPGVHLLGRHALELDRDVRGTSWKRSRSSFIIGVSLTQEAKVIVTGSVGSGISG